jgi:hypothetical protein
MGFQDDPNVILWHLHLNRPPHELFVNGSPVRDSEMPVCARICAASGPTTWWPVCCRCRWGRSSGWPTYHL